MIFIFSFFVSWASPWSENTNDETPLGPFRSEVRRETRENFFEEISRSTEPRDDTFRAPALSRVKTEDLAPLESPLDNDDLEGSRELEKLPWSHYEGTSRTRPGSFLWPVAKGRITSGFGPRGGSFHEGIDIKARSGAPIRVATNGRVVFSGRLNGYGRTMVVAHGGGVATVYAHNEQNLMEVGDRVHQGETIGFVGATGHASGSHLHFEVRVKGKPQNPLGHSFTRVPEVTAAR